MIARLFKRDKAHRGDDGRRLIVVVDDEPDLCALLAAALQAQGYAVETANDGEAGLGLIRRRRPALAILDIKMPKMNGYQVLTEMQKDLVLAKTAVFVTTSQDVETTFSPEEWAERLNVAKFFPKPYDPDKIAEAAREVVPPGA